MKDGKNINYKDLIRIGSGGMSNVSRATHPLLQRHVVLKEINKKFSEDRILLERFKREAITLARMCHQNIVQIYDYWSSGRKQCIVMEYVDGHDLSKIIEKLGEIPPAIALNIGLQVINGLNYAHKKEIIHRDVKPHNIMISITGEVKLMDFGIALKNEDSSLTKPGTVIGTPNYMSPEQVVGDTLTFQSDVFSFGCVMYEMLTGVLPFEEGGDGSIYTKIRTHKHVPVRAINPTVSRGVAKLVDVCLQKNPARRFKSTLELLGKLEYLLKKELKGFDVNEHLMKFLLESDIYDKNSNLSMTANLSQKVTRIVKERGEEFGAYKRQEFIQKIFRRGVVIVISGFIIWLGYFFAMRYFEPTMKRMTKSISSKKKSYKSNKRNSKKYYNKKKRKRRGR